MASMPSDAIKLTQSTSVEWMHVKGEEEEENASTQNKYDPNSEAKYTHTHARTFLSQRKIYGIECGVFEPTLLASPSSFIQYYLVYCTIRFFFSFSNANVLVLEKHDIYIYK